MFSLDVWTPQSQSHPQSSFIPTTTTNGSTTNDNNNNVSIAGGGGGIAGGGGGGRGGGGEGGGWGYLEEVRILTGSKDHQVCVSRLAMKKSSTTSNNTSGGSGGSSSGGNNSSSSSSGGSMSMSLPSSIDGIVVERVFDSLHRGVVKCVHWRPGHGGPVTNNDI